MADLGAFSEQLQRCLLLHSQCENQLSSSNPHRQQCLLGDSLSPTPDTLTYNHHIYHNCRRRPTTAIMRGACIFSGTSHPALVDAICERLGTNPSKVDSKKFANGETSVEISMDRRNTAAIPHRPLTLLHRDVGARPRCLHRSIRKQPV